MITFRGEHTGSIMMFDEPALKLLRMMDTSGSRKGALVAEDVPAALAALEAALAAVAPPPPTDAKGDEDRAEGKIGIEQRAVPLLDLLRRAVATESYITWGQ